MRQNVDKRDIATLYVDEVLTIRQIAKHKNVSTTTVLRHLVVAGIPRRVAGKGASDRLRDRDWLMHRYLVDRRSTTEIAEELGCFNGTVGNWLARHGIKARGTGSEKGHSRVTEISRHKMALAGRGKRIGSENPNWKGGVALKDYDRNRYKSKMWVKSIKDRDGWKCTKCAATERLHAHHIKRWKDHPDLRYEISNGVTLCHSCHEAAHGRGFKFRWPQARKSPTSASVSK